MNWAAMNYVKRLKRESGINGNLRFVLLMIASRVLKGRIETAPTSLHFLAATTGNDKKTVRNLLKRLVELHEVRVVQKGGGRGKKHVFVMPSLQGPLFMVPGEEKGESPPPFRGSEKGESLTPFWPPEKGESFSSFTPERGKSRARSVLPSTSQPLSTTTTAAAEKPAVAVICDETLSFLHWVAEHYRITVDYQQDGPRIERLLAGPPRRELALVQAMTVVMFTVTASEEPFLAQAPDRGLKLLCYAADRLERIALQRQRPATVAACLYKHTPPCASAAACAALERRLVAERDRLEVAR